MKRAITKVYMRGTTPETSHLVKVKGYEVNILGFNCVVHHEVLSNVARPAWGVVSSDRQYGFRLNKKEWKVTEKMSGRSFGRGRTRQDAIDIARGRLVESKHFKEGTLASHIMCLAAEIPDSVREWDLTEG